MKEKTDRQVILKVQPSLYKAFEAKCVEEYRTVSEVLRELMSKYSRGWQLYKEIEMTDENAVSPLQNLKNMWDEMKKVKPVKMQAGLKGPDLVKAEDFERLCRVVDALTNVVLSFAEECDDRNSP